jgi:hypothetical protein
LPFHLCWWWCLGWRSGMDEWNGWMEWNGRRGMEIIAGLNDDVGRWINGNWGWQHLEEVWWCNVKPPTNQQCWWC